MEQFHGTTIVSARRGARVAMGGEGQVTLGGAYAQAAARALLEHSALTAEQVVRNSLAIAGELCIYTNQHHTIETLGPAS